MVEQLILIAFQQGIRGQAHCLRFWGRHSLVRLFHNLQPCKLNLWFRRSMSWGEHGWILLSNNNWVRFYFEYNMSSFIIDSQYIVTNKMSTETEITLDLKKKVFKILSIVSHLYAPKLSQEPIWPFQKYLGPCTFSYVRTEEISSLSWDLTISKPPLQSPPFSLSNTAMKSCIKMQESLHSKEYAHRWSKLAIPIFIFVRSYILKLSEDCLHNAKGHTGCAYSLYVVLTAQKKEKLY